MDTEDVGHSTTQPKKEWNNAICRWMDLEVTKWSMYFTYWAKSEKERQAIWYHLYIDSKYDKWTYQCNRNRLTDRKQTYSNQRGSWGREGMD